MPRNAPHPPRHRLVLRGAQHDDALSRCGARTHSRRHQRRHGRGVRGRYAVRSGVQTPVDRVALCPAAAPAPDTRVWCGWVERSQAEQSERAVVRAKPSAATGVGATGAKPSAAPSAARAGVSGRPRAPPMRSSIGRAVAERASAGPSVGGGRGGGEARRLGVRWLPSSLYAMLCRRIIVYHQQSL